MMSSRLAHHSSGDTAVTTVEVMAEEITDMAATVIRIDLIRMAVATEVTAIHLPLQHQAGVT